MVSRVHAVIEVRDDRVFIRDQGTTNGTQINNKLLRGEQTEVKNGDELAIGPLKFRFAIEGQPAGDVPAPAPAKPAPRSQILDAGGDDLDASTEIFILKAADGPRKGTGESSATLAVAKTLESAYLTHEVLQDVLVITVLQPVMKDQSTIDPVRYALSYILELPVPRKVIVNLENVTELSQRALVMLLAQSQRLEKVKGTLRLCNLRDDVAAFVDNLKPPVPIDCHPTLAEALQAARR
jgi:anti-anti-sigma regulatory factor